MVAAAVDTMIDELSMGLDETGEEDPNWEWQSGVALFDSLTAAQRIALLHGVAEQLLTDTALAQDPSAAAEATVAAVYNEVRDQVAIEIDLFPESHEGPPRVITPLGPKPRRAWRKLVLAAHEEVRHLAWVDEGDPEPAEVGTGEEEWTEGLVVPAADCLELDRWEEVIDYLADSILWDRDFELAESFLDVDPGLSQQRRRLLGIGDDYFTQVAPDPLPLEILELVAQTRALVRSKPR